MQTIAQIREAATSALVAFYNANVPEEKQIKKFSDRPTAVARCLKIGVDLNLPENEEELAAEEEAAAQPASMFAQLGGGLTAQQKAATSSLRASGQKVVSGKTVVEGEPSDDDEPLIPFKASNAAGVSASWSNEEVRAARLTRDGVAVSCNGAPESEHKSTRDAFRHYRLPDSKHIRFRLRLKANGTETFEWGGKKYVFTLRPIAAE